MSQPSMFYLPESRRKVAKAVPRSSRLTYQAEHARLDARSDNVKAWLRQCMEPRGGFWFVDPPTSAELAAWADARPLDWTAHKLYVRRGLSDLQAQNVVEKAGDRPCRVSGRTCATWRLTTR